MRRCMLAGTRVKKKLRQSSPLPSRRLNSCECWSLHLSTQEFGVDLILTAVLLLRCLRCIGLPSKANSQLAQHIPHGAKQVRLAATCAGNLHTHNQCRAIQRVLEEQDVFLLVKDVLEV